MRRSLVLGGALGLWLTVTGVKAQFVTIDLGSEQGQVGRVGNRMAFASAGLSLSASAWSYGTRRNPDAFAEAALGQWETGLGVLNRDELRNRSPYEHQLDSIGEADYVLFLFDSPVNLVEVVVDPYGVWDSDLVYWSGMIHSHAELAGRSMTDLASAGFHPTVAPGVPSDAPRRVTLSSPGPVNALLLGVPRAGESSDLDVDKFKIQQLHLSCIPEPSSLGLLLLGAGAWCLRRRP